MALKPQIPPFSAVRRAIAHVANELLDRRTGEFAEQEADLFRARIKAQKFQAFIDYPLSPRYLARKAAAGADLRTMIATAHYIKAIRALRRRGVDGKPYWMVGFHWSAKARNLDGSVSQLLLSDVAAIQEFGSAAAHIPPRPHWRPQAKEMARRAVPFRRRVAAEIAKKANAELVKSL